MPRFNFNSKPFNQYVEEELFLYESFVKDAPEIVLYLTFANLKNKQKELFAKHGITLPDDNISPPQRFVSNGSGSYIKQHYTFENYYMDKLSLDEAAFARAAELFTKNILRAVETTKVPLVPNSHFKSAVLNRNENKFERWQENWKNHVEKLFPEKKQKLNNATISMQKEYSNLKNAHLKSCEDAQTNLPRPYLWNLDEWIEDHEFTKETPLAGKPRETLLYGLSSTHTLREIACNIDSLREDFESLQPQKRIVRKTNNIQKHSTLKRQQPRLPDGTFTFY